MSVWKQTARDKAIFGTIPTFRSCQARPEGLAVGYPEPIAKTRNRRKVNFPQFDDAEPDKDDFGLSNNSDFFDRYIQDNRPPDPADYLYKCTKGFIWGETKANNYYKAITCGREWCADCGKKHSMVHDRRISRHLAELMGLNQALYSIQYLVITIPRELRPLYRSKEALNRFRTYWREKLKREGHKWGLMRYHYCGEDGYLWKPHLNILTIGGFVPRGTLREWRAELGRWFKMQHKLRQAPAANIYTAYSQEPDKLRHWLSYVTRATQTTYNKLNEETIRGYRNTSVFKDKGFEIPPWQPEGTKEKTAEEQAAAEGYELLPDGSREKIVWRMKFDEFKKRWRPEVIPLIHTRINEFELVRRGMWREPKYHPPPD